MEVFDWKVPHEGTNRDTGETKTYWNNVGVMFVGEDRNGNPTYSMQLYMFPGTTFRAYPREERRSEPKERPRQKKLDDDDDTPF